MDADQVAIAKFHSMSWRREAVTAGNYMELLAPQVAADTLVVNVATSISSLDVLAWAQQRGAYYLDTCIDPWEYQDGEIGSAANTNYQMREAVMALQAVQRASGLRLPTAVVAHGANPGLVSVLVKEALLELARRHLAAPAAPCSATEWALLAQQLGVRVIQIAERDHQHSRHVPAPGEFVNTWSVQGYIAEALQPAELGWGSHEAAGPMAARAHGHAAGCRAAVWLDTLGVHARVRSWTPLAGEFTGRLISHNEAMSIAAHLTLGDAAAPAYRPTVYYAYHPCDLAEASLALLEGGSREPVTRETVLKQEIDGGIDELGVLLVSDRFPSLWLGSQLSIERARAIAPHNNATSLQVVGSMLAAIEWLLLNPRAGIVETEAMDHHLLLEHARPYWEPLVCEQRAWQPDPVRAEPRWTLDEFWA